MSKWVSPPAEDFGSYDHFKCTEQRTVKYTIYANYLYPKLPQEQYNMMCDRSDTALNVFQVTRTFKAFYADQQLIYSMYEVRTPDKRSNQVAIRFTTEFHWLERPWVGATTAENQYYSKMKSGFDYLEGWMPAQIQKWKHDSETA